MEAKAAKEVRGRPREKGKITWDTVIDIVKDVKSQIEGEEVPCKYSTLYYMLKMCPSKR